MAQYLDKDGLMVMRDELKTAFSQVENNASSKMWNIVTNLAAPKEHYHDKILSEKHTITDLNTVDLIDVENSSMGYLKCGWINKSNTTGVPNDSSFTIGGEVISVFTGLGHGLQIVGEYKNRGIYTRNRNADDKTWTSWKRLAFVEDIPTIPTITDEKVKANTSTGKIYLVGQDDVTNGTTEIVYKNASVYMQSGKMYAGSGSINSSETALVTGAAVNAAINTALSSALQYCGALASDSNVSTAATKTGKKKGDVYVASATFKPYKTYINNWKDSSVEAGDLFIFDGSKFDIVNGENQVEQLSHTLAWDTDVSIAKIDGTTITVKLPSNPNTDYQTTKAGHYTPSDKDSSVTLIASGNSVAGGGAVVTGVTKDSKGHITGVTTSKLPTSLPANGGNANNSTYFSNRNINEFMIYSNNPNYVAARFVDTSLSVKAAETYVEYWSSGGWYNCKWGTISAKDKFVGNLQGTADSATKASKLANYYTSRPSSANLTHVGDGAVSTFKATSIMSTGRPPVDGHILHFEWDDSGLHNSQLCIANNYGGSNVEYNYPLQLRCQSGKDWNQSTWHKVALINETHANDLINSLSVGESDATLNDYIICQYAGGGSTTNTYHRRSLSKLLTKANLPSHGTHWEGFTVLSNSNATWGTLRAANGYTPVLWMATSSGGGIGFSDKGDRTYMQIDGEYYANEGSNLVLHTGNYTNYCKDTKVTSAANHYEPSNNDSSKLTLNASSNDSATWGSTDLITGLTIKRDNRGHVVDVSISSIQLPSNPNTDYQTTKAGHYTPSDKDSSVTATASGTVSWSGAVVTGVTKDSKGHITGVTTSTIPSNPNTDTKVTVYTSTGTVYLVGQSGITTGTNSTLYKNSSVYMSNGSITAYSFFETSDERLKTFTDDIDIDLNKLSDLRKSYFTFNSDESNKSHIGISAQEVQKLYPEIVNTNEDGYLSVDYAKLSVIALKAVDVLYNQNKDFERRLKEIEDKLK